MASKTQILTSVWGYDDYDPNLVEVYVSTLRRKLEARGPRLLHTVRGLGYVLREGEPGSMPASGFVTGVLRTVSLRRRVTWTALAVMSVVLIGVVVVVHALFGVVVNRGVNAVLADRVQLAEQLARQNVGPTVLIERVDARSVRGRLVLPDGQTYGSLSQARLADPRVKRRQVRLHSAGRLNGTVLTLAAESTLLSGAQSRLLWVLAATGVSALLVTAAALLVGVRRALAPLDAMTALAGRIAQGSRAADCRPPAPTLNWGARRQHST